MCWKAWFLFNLLCYAMDRYSSQIKATITLNPWQRQSILSSFLRIFVITSAVKYSSRYKSSASRCDAVSDCIDGSFISFSTNLPLHFDFHICYNRSMHCNIDSMGPLCLVTHLYINFSINRCWYSKHNISSSLKSLPMFTHTLLKFWFILSWI